MTPGKCSAVVTLSMWDKCYYIITLENTIECILEGHDLYPNDRVMLVYMVAPNTKLGL